MLGFLKRQLISLSAVFTCKTNQKRSTSANERSNKGVETVPFCDTKVIEALDIFVTLTGVALKSPKLTLTNYFPHQCEPTRKQTTNNYIQRWSAFPKENTQSDPHLRAVRRLLRWDCKRIAPSCVLQDAQIQCIGLLDCASVRSKTGS